MATNSFGFLDVDEPTRQPRHHRSRSNGYVDQLEEQAKWARHDRGLQMKRYHESSRHSSSTHQRTQPDNLCVPVFEPNRRPRSSERLDQQRNESPRSFRVEEVRPDPRPLYDDYNLKIEPVLPSQLPTKYEWKPQPPQSKPKIEVQIIQDNPPPPYGISARTPKRSPSASPNSPTAQPELQFQYARLQTELARISLTCSRYKDVEPADPRDLTFERIAAQVEGYAFDLQVWSQIAHLAGLAMVEKSKRSIADAVSRYLDRLTVRASELHDACAMAKPRDLKSSPLPNVSDGEGEYELYDDGDGDNDVDDPTEAPGFIIQSLLHSIELQLQNLKRISRSLQEATPDARDEMVSVTRLVEETAQYFGSDAALKLHSIDIKYAGGKALKEARYTAGVA